MSVCLCVCLSVSLSRSYFSAMAQPILTFYGSFDSLWPDPQPFFSSFQILIFLKFYENLKFLKKNFLSNFRCDIRYMVNIDVGNPNLHLVFRLGQVNQIWPFKGRKVRILRLFILTVFHWISVIYQSFTQYAKISSPVVLFCSIDVSLLRTDSRNLTLRHAVARHKFEVSVASTGCHFADELSLASRASPLTPLGLASAYLGVGAVGFGFGNSLGPGFLVSRSGGCGISALVTLPSAINQMGRW